MTDGTKEWDVIIYSMYETIEEAEEGIKRFSFKGYNVIKAWID